MPILRDSSVATTGMPVAPFGLLLAILISVASVPAARGQTPDTGVNRVSTTSSGVIAREEIDSGIVEALEPERGSIVIEGYRYVLTPDVPVARNGVAAAAADLAVGMQVQFRFLRADGQLPRLLEVRVVPPERRIYRR